jgi:hypothetical protein
MGDATTRAELEETQMELRRLRQTLADWPAVSAERKRLQVELQQLAPELEALRARLSTRHADEASARDARSLHGGKAWWRTPFSVVAAFGALVASVWAVGHSLDYINWTYWGPVAAPVLLAVAPGVNLARCALAVRRRQKRLRPIAERRRSN